MRLRLRIERNALPPTQAIWPVKDGRSTIAQLLQQVNETFPLEGATWGLEDYSVTVGGYECLHYHELGSACRDEDEVVIKPLQYVDVRARTLTGRDQIAADGRHLMDGVPFGRPCLKGPIRPEVRIPPRKTRRLLGNEDQDEPQFMITQYGEDMGDVDDGDSQEEDDEDFEMDVSDELTSNEDSSASESEYSSSDSSDDSSSDSTSSSESDSDDESWAGIPASNPGTPRTKATSDLPNGIDHSDSSDSTTGSKRKRDPTDEGLQSESLTIPGQGKAETKNRNKRRREAKELKHLKNVGTFPPNADLATLREWRERGSTGVMEAQNDASIDKGLFAEQSPATDIIQNGKSMRSESHATSHTAADTSPSTDINTSAIKSSSLSQITSFVPRAVAKTSKRSKQTKSDTKKTASSADNLEDRRDKLLKQLASGGIDITKRNDEKRQRLDISLPEDEADEDGPPEELSTKQQFENEGVDDQLQEDLANTVMKVTTPGRRLDIAGSKRLLFGSLGVRVPKTQEERDKLQKKLAERPKRNANADHGTEPANKKSKEVETSEGIDEVEEESDAWRGKLQVTAVECCDPGIELSAPPFPFQQRWDPQYNRKKKRNQKQYMESSKSRSRSRNSDYVETYDKYNIGPNGDALEYDDVDAGEEEYWEDGALLGDYEEEEAEKDDGFPPAPVGLAGLENLSVEQVRKGDFIAYAELACDESTEWQPKTVIRTAKMIEVPEQGGEEVTIQLANRDINRKAFDDDGNRVYSKFEMPDFDADDEGRREVSWSELGAVKLALRPELSQQE